jgi:hypothetical protein
LDASWGYLIVFENVGEKEKFLQQNQTFTAKYNLNPHFTSVTYDRSQNASLEDLLIEQRILDTNAGEQLS